MNNYNKTLFNIYCSPRALQSDFARANAKVVAEAASRGHITSVIAGIGLNDWHITVLGMEHLRRYGFIEQGQQTETTV